MRDQFLYKEKCQSLTYFTELKTRSCTFTTIARTSVTQLSALVDLVAGDFTPRSSVGQASPSTISSDELEQHAESCVP